jgi:hypothetical protein
MNQLDALTSLRVFGFFLHINKRIDTDYDKLKFDGVTSQLTCHMYEHRTPCSNQFLE